jgi:hypothetical protein
VGAFGTELPAHVERTLMSELKVKGCCYGQLSREDVRQDGLADCQRSILQTEPSEVETADRRYIAHAGAFGTCRRVQLRVVLKRSAPYL